MILNFMDPFHGDGDVVGLDDELVEEKRGFKPSDVHDPGKREFLTQLRKSANQSNDNLSNAQRRHLLHLYSTAWHGHLPK